MVSSVFLSKRLFQNLRLCACEVNMVVQNYEKAATYTNLCSIVGAYSTQNTSSNPLLRLLKMGVVAIFPPFHLRNRNAGALNT